MLNFKFKVLLKIVPAFSLILILVGFNTFNQVTVKAIPPEFIPSQIITTADFKNKPENYNSAEKIRNFFEQKGSYLANLEVEISLEPDDDLLAFTPTTRPELAVSKVLQPYLNKKMSVSDLIWNLSQGEMGNGCSMSSPGICVDNTNDSINPVFILGMIQRESGLSFGVNSKQDPNSDFSKALQDRALGYYCFETKDRTKGCFNENPDWKYYRGFFRQLYYGIRYFRLYEKICNGNGRVVGGQLFKTGNTINIDGAPLRLDNGITCALYMYTPHVYNGQFNLWKAMGEIQGVDASIYFRRIRKPRSILGLSAKNSKSDVIEPPKSEDQKYYLDLDNDSLKDI
jgi:hypothetical protein